MRSPIQEELAVDPEQSRVIEGVLEGNYETARQFWAESRQQFRSDIRAVLTEEQATCFDDLLVERDARRKDRDGEDD